VKYGVGIMQTTHELQGIHLILSSNKVLLQRPSQLWLALGQKHWWTLAWLALWNMQII